MSIIPAQPGWKVSIALPPTAGTGLDDEVCRVVAWRAETYRNVTTFSAIVMPIEADNPVRLEDFATDERDGSPLDWAIYYERDA